MPLPTTRGKVPQFSLRPHPVVLGLMILVAVVGLLLALSFFAKEDGTGIYLHRGVVTLITTGIATILLSIVATSKMWYPHLWNKNSTHDRHKQHSQYHPSQRYPESSRGRKR